MIVREDILSMEYLKKSDYTGCHQGMRYRLEGADGPDSGRVLRVTVWPEPFNFFKTPQEQKISKEFPFKEEGVVEAISWMNGQLLENRERWERAGENWTSYRME